MADVLVVIPTRSRAGIGTTWKLFPNAILAVRNDEEKIYREAGLLNEFWLHDENTSARTRNFILDRVGAGGEVVICDDDIRGAGEFFEKTPGRYASRKLDPVDFLRKLRMALDMAKIRRAHLIGVAPTTNPLIYNPRRLVHPNVFINGPLMGIRVTNLRFDTDLPVKCDYDFTVQHIASRRGVLRFDGLWQDNDFDTLPGGRSCYKKEGDKEASFRRLLQKWPGFFRPNTKRQWELILKAPKEYTCASP
jgi:hypothetical protein